MGKVCSAMTDHRAYGDTCASDEFSDCVSSVGVFEANDRHTSGSFFRKRMFPLVRSMPSKKLRSELVPSAEGRRRSLLVGINYYNTNDELHGCVNDVMRMVPVLKALGFPSDSDNQRVLTDGPSADPEQHPTRATILEAIAWLVEGARTGDALFFHYSGHGGREIGSSDQAHFRETLVPVDFETAGLLDDQEITRQLVDKLPEGCRLTCLIDSAHGAGAPVALPSMFVGDTGAVNAAKLGGPAVSRGMQRWTAGSKQQRDAAQVKAEVLVITSRETSLPPWSKWRQGTTEGICTKPFCGTDDDAATVHTGALYVDQSRAPGGANWGYGGVLTSALLEVLSKPRSDLITLLGVLEKINKDFAERGYMQAPLIAASKTLDLRQQFELDTWLC